MLILDKYLFTKYEILCKVSINNFDLVKLSFAYKDILNFLVNITVLLNVYFKVVRNHQNVQYIFLYILSYILNPSD